MAIAYFIAVYLAALLCTNYISKRVNADTFITKMLRVNTRTKVAIFAALTSTVIYLFLVLVSEVFGLQIGSFVFSAISLGITIGLITAINKRLLAKAQNK